jgi:hypothetical protein
MNLLPGSTVPAVSQTLDNPFEFSKIHCESTFPSKGDLPSPNVEMLEVASSIKMLLANTVNAGAISVTTFNKHKEGNPPKKAAPRKPKAKKAVEKQGSKAALKGGNKKRDVKGTSVIDADFFNFPPPSIDPGKYPASGTASLKMGIAELSSPLPPTKDYHKQRMQRAKNVKVTTRPAALKVQVGWKMIEV